VIFSDVGPDIRWVGNERGYAGETCWATYDPVGPDGGVAAPGYVRHREGLAGHRNGSKWLPPECDVSIRPGWFWHEKENGKVKSSEQLFDLYTRSVGRGGGFLLNVPPDRRGLFHEADLASLHEFGAIVRQSFAKNYAAGAKLNASNVRGRLREFDARNMLDPHRYSYWATDDGVTTPEVTMELEAPAKFNLIRLRENIRLGQRVEAFAVDQWKDGAWAVLGEATSIGACRIVKLEQPVAAGRVRLRILKSPVSPAISEFGIFEMKGP
jgi:alpha-L-fucosidase